MSFKIVTSSTNQEIYIYDKSDPLHDSLEEDKYYFLANIFIIDEKNNTSVAEFHIYLFNEDAIYFDGFDLTYIADSIDQDNYNAISMLEKHKDFEFDFTSKFSGYIDRIYVNPSYRRQGFCNYLFNNLTDICSFCFNVNIRYLITYPKAQIEDDKQIISYEEDLKGENTNIIIKAIQKNGFELIKNTGYYLRDFSINQN